jgi:hypothetical protein
MKNALEILKALKSNPNAMLWINSERKEAAYNDGEDDVGPVDYQTAMLVRPDPSLFTIDTTDGETLSSNPSLFIVDTAGGMSDFRLGEAAAQDEMRHPDFDLMAAICSFDGDPAETSFQRGYLDALLSAHEAELTA